jgi:hypothetical protein
LRPARARLARIPAARTLRRGLIALVAGLVVAGGPFAAHRAAARPPDYPLIEYDKGNYARSMTLIFWNMPDPGGPRTFWISCDGGANRSPDYAYAHEVEGVSLALPGCEGYGLKTVDVQLEDQDHQSIFWTQVTPGISPRMHVQMPLPAMTGHQFTFDPEYPADYDLPADAICRWEFRWGNDQSLDHNDYDETFGALGFDADAVDGDCPTWTFTLPWVPYRQFELYLDVGLIDNGERAWVKGDYVRFDAAEDGTNRRITTSNLPVAQVLPDTYTPIVGQSVTYTRYLVGGAKGGGAVWTAWQGAGDNPNVWHQDGGETFTITPRETGNVTVGWQRMDTDRLFYAMYDPPVRHRDRVRPTTTTPKATLDGGAAGDRVPVKVTWDGADSGWGIEKYQLERSTDGGAWKRVLARKTKHFDEALLPGHAYRYRVRAVDWAGNRGTWDVGAAVRPRLVADGSASIEYGAAWTSVPDATALGGWLHEAGTASARATFRFAGRDIGWVAERGPTHGKAKVYVDGKLAATVDLTAGADAPRRLVFRRHWNASGDHRIKVVVVGTAARPTVDVDGFVVLR